jgi:cellulose synthase/poly-beta-1,6-N-acetylglucosamine synthase-like glycosyltransferase
MIFLLTFPACGLFIIYGALIVVYYRAWKAIPVFVSGKEGGVSAVGGVVPGTGAMGSATRISVLIPARNEEKNIVDCLRSLAQQTYPKDLFEVIILDDHSTDGTAAAVSAFVGGGLRVSCVRMAEVPHPETIKAHKKFAIETGVKKACGELIVTTDADCTFPAGWLTTLADCYEEKGAKFIAAPVRIVSRNRSLLSIFQILDFLTLQGITGAAVYKRFHSMCNGANLAFSREAFFAVDGYRDIDSIPSGDDMFLMHKIWLRYPYGTFFLKSREAIVSTAAETTWKRFIHQRTRWASKADRYDDKRIFWVLLLVYLLNVLFILLAVGACWNPWWLWLLVVLLFVKTVVEYPFVSAVAVFFGQGDLMVYFAPLQPLHICYTVVIGWLGKFGSYQWKDRKISK